MNIQTKQWCDARHWLLIISLAMPLWLLAPSNGQNTPPQGPANAQQNDNDTTRRQLAGMDRFLDGHPEIAEQLRRDPSLINNDEFVERHPSLQEFLQEHPGIREEFSENPQAFMRREERFERHEDRGFGDNDTTRRQLAGMDRFLDAHPEIAEQLRKDPSLIRNQQFVNSHPELGQFLQEHPGIREEFSENPEAFMRREERYDRREGERGEGFPDRDATRSQVARMDGFLDKHPEIDEQLRKNPDLIRNEQFVNSHPELHAFLEKHPEIREEFGENPQAFMRSEERYDRHEDRWNHTGDRDSTRAQADFGQFLGAHSLMSQQLSKDPSLLNNKEYLESHSELRDYLSVHPDVQKQLAANPQAFMSAVQQSGSTTTGKTVAPKPPKSD